MKQLVSYAFVSFLLLHHQLLALQSYTTGINEWSLIGASEKVDIVKHSSSACVIFTFDRKTQNYSQYLGTQEFSSQESIAPEEGFFVFGNGAPCVIDTGRDFTLTKFVTTTTLKTAATYHIKLTNATFNQPFSSTIFIVQRHDGVYKAFSVGEEASLGLEKLAEGGGYLSLLQEAKANKVLFSDVFDKILLSGFSREIEIGLDSNFVKLTVLTKLINTNDAFAAVADIDLNFNGKKRVELMVYDSGTEANDEQLGTVSGLGGEGYNSHRSDIINFVTLHPGVLGTQDGLIYSGLDQTHKFDNPAGILEITRKE